MEHRTTGMQQVYYVNRPETAARPPAKPRRRHGPLVYCLLFIGILGFFVAIVCLALLSVLVSDSDRIKVVSSSATTKIGLYQNRTKRQASTSDITYVFTCREDYEPYCYRDANGKFVGLMKDVTDCVCKTQSKNCKWVLDRSSDNWNYLDYSPALTYGRTHAVCGFYQTDSRDRSATFFGQVYSAPGVRFYKNVGTSIIISLGLSFHNYTLGYAPAFTTNLKCLLNTKFAAYVESRADNYMDDLINKLRRREVDIVLSNDDEKISRQSDIDYVTNLDTTACNRNGGGCYMSKISKLNGCLGTWFETGLGLCAPTIKQACLNYTNPSSRCISRFL